MSKASNEMTEHAEHAEAVYKPSEHGGLREDGQPDKRMSSEHGWSLSTLGGFDPALATKVERRADFWLGPGFGGNKELAHEAGVKGGKVGQEQQAYE